MDADKLVQAVFAGICLYAAIVHLMIGFRSRPRDTVNLSFAGVSLLFGIYSINIYFLKIAVDSGSVPLVVSTDKWGILSNYLAYAALFWFIAIYTHAKRRFVPLITVGIYVAIALSNYVLPYTWVYTDIIISNKTEPVIMLSPWYKIEGPLTLLVFIVYSAIYISRQHRNGERTEAWALTVAVGTFLSTYIWDIFFVEYGIVPFFLLQQYGIATCIVIMSLRLTGLVVEAEKRVRHFAIELEKRVEERTEELAIANKTLIKARDEAQAANRAKSVFLSNISHELRTPLNAILGHAQIMFRDSSLTLKQQHAVKAVHRSGEHLLTLINSVLEMSKIEAGQTILNPSSFSIDSLISDMKIMFDERVKKKGLAFCIEKDINLVTAIKADQGKISQILINLLSNAVHHTHTGVITLRVTMEETPDNGLQLIIEVEDTGEGIAAEDLERIFNPFVQVDSNRTEHTGTGLGLAISRQFSRIMGGDLNVESRVGQGSTFHLVIPVNAAESVPLDIDLKLARRVVGIAGEKREFRVLVVDDESSNRDVIIRMLSPAGFDIREANGGSEAINLFESWSPHIILMDIRMPKVDGIEAIKTIKSKNKGQTIPIIGISASVFIEDRYKVLESGADDFISKPIQETELWEKLGHCLNVEFLYDDKQQPATDPSDTPALTIEHLLELPEELLEKIRSLVQGGYMERLGELAKNAAENYPELSQQLMKLVDHYDNEALWQLFLSDAEKKDA